MVYEIRMYHEIFLWSWVVSFYSNVLNFVLQCFYTQSIKWFWDQDFVIKPRLYFIICKLLGILKICFLALLFKQLLLTAHYAQKYLLDCFILFLLYFSLNILPAKPPGCSSFLFAWVWVIPAFQMINYIFLGSWQAHFGFFQLYNARKLH